MEQHSDALLKATERLLEIADAITFRSLETEEFLTVRVYDKAWQPPVLGERVPIEETEEPSFKTLLGVMHVIANNQAEMLQVQREQLELIKQHTELFNTLFAANKRNFDQNIWITLREMARDVDTLRTAFDPKGPAGAKYNFIVNDRDTNNRAAVRTYCYS